VCVDTFVPASTEAHRAAHPSTRHARVGRPQDLLSSDPPARLEAVFVTLSKLFKDNFNENLFVWKEICQKMFIDSLRFSKNIST